MAVILAENALAVLERVRADFGFSVTTHDDKILRAINSASGHIERYCGRVFWRDTAIAEKVAGYGTTEMRVARRPINSITSIAFDGTTIDSDDYDISDVGAGMIDKVNGWAWTAHVAPGISSGVMPGTERRLFTVTYDGGWYTPNQSRARGTITFTDQPANAETMVINNTTVEAKTSGASTDEFNIGADVRVTCDNLVAAINATAGAEFANVRAWRVGLTVVFEWLEEGTDGNAVIFTTGLANTTVDGTGTLGATQAGVVRTLPWDLENACIELSRVMYLSKNRDPSVSNERLMSWSASYNVITQGGKMPASIARDIDLYKVLTL